jgi:hypothetical protein
LGHFKITTVKLGQDFWLLSRRIPLFLLMNNARSYHGKCSGIHKLKSSVFSFQICVHLADKIGILGRYVPLDRPWLGHQPLYVLHFLLKF